MTEPIQIFSLCFIRPDKTVKTVATMFASQTWITVNTPKLKIGDVVTGHDIMYNPVTFTITSIESAKLNSRVFYLSGPLQEDTK